MKPGEISVPSLEVLFTKTFRPQKVCEGQLWELFLFLLRGKHSLVIQNIYKLTLSIQKNIV